MGFGHRNCVVMRCPNSGQRLGKWAAATCELHGCNCDCQPPFKLFPFPTEKKNPERRLPAITMGKKYKQEQFEWDSLDA